MMLLCLAAMWLAGFGLLRWMFPQPLRWSLHNVLLFSLAIGTGAGVASWLYFLTLVLAGPGFRGTCVGGRRSARDLSSAGPAGEAQGSVPRLGRRPGRPLVLDGLVRSRDRAGREHVPGRRGLHPHGEEAAWSIWNLRARFLFLAGAFWRDAFSSDLSWSHLDYPLLLPGLVAMCWKLAGQESSDAPIAIAFLFALGTTGVLVSALGVLRGKTHALLAGTLLTATASFVALSAALYGDVPLSFYILATLALLCCRIGIRRTCASVPWRD